jgi:omega-amidase
MKITIVQPNTVWEDKDANFRNIEHLLSNIRGKSDLIVLPEMFTTGFSLNAQILAEESGGRTLKWMINLSENGNFAVCGSFITREVDKFYNHFAFVTPGNEQYSFDKRHLFSLAGENEVYTCGANRIVIPYENFRFLPIICYDLRFPVWIRNRGDYDAIICVASWPDIRREAWNTLLKARAIENQCFVIGVNRSGTDNEGLKYAGDSVVIDPHGRILAGVTAYKEGIETVEISLADVQNFRKKFPVWKDADDFTINF